MMKEVPTLKELVNLKGREEKSEKLSIMRCNIN